MALSLVPDFKSYLRCVVNKFYFQVSGYAFEGLGLQIAPSLSGHRFSIRVSGGLLFRHFAGVNSH